jgi:hypothetical protein
MCRKFHYSVPQSFGVAPTVLRFDAASNSLMLYPLTKQSAQLEKGGVKTVLDAPSAQIPIDEI